MSNPYKEAARKHGVSEAEIIAEIEKAIAAAYENPNEFAKTVPCKGDIPTADEIIRFAGRVGM